MTRYGNRHGAGLVLIHHDSQPALQVTLRWSNSGAGWHRGAAPLACVLAPPHAHPAVPPTLLRKAFWPVFQFATVLPPPLLISPCLPLGHTPRWKVASGGKFGFSVQRDIWNQNQKRWAKFIKQLDWVSGEYSIYRKWNATAGEFNYTIDAPRGHLPLTNALRGTQVGGGGGTDPARPPATNALRGDAGGRGVGGRGWGKQKHCIR